MAIVANPALAGKRSDGVPQLEPVRPLTVMRHVRSMEPISMSILKWALFFFVISLVAGVFGFTGISAASADIARVLFYVFVVIFLALLILGLTIFRV